MFSRGVSREESRLCHRQVYGGLVRFPTPPFIRFLSPTRAPFSTFALAVASTELFLSVLPFFSDT